MPHSMDDPGTRRKLIAFDAETWMALELLGRDRMATLQELADEAFRDLLGKYRRPATLNQALRASAGDRERTGKRAKGKAAQLSR